MILPFRRQHTHDTKANEPRCLQQVPYDGFSRHHDTKADHSFWRPVVNTRLVDVARIADASPAYVLDRVKPADEDIRHGDRLGDVGVREHGASPLLVDSSREFGRRHRNGNRG
jgi:hypothetical protein